MTVQPFTRFKAVAAPFGRVNVDTDQVIPARFLNLAYDDNYADTLFHDLRFDKDERPRPDFVLNQAPFDQAKIMVAAQNYGCGSSREQAVYAMRDWGFRAVIAPSFGDIFYANCFKNGVLPIRTTEEVAATLRAQLEASPGAEIEIDLDSQAFWGPDGTRYGFDVDPFRKDLLAKGEDELGLTLGLLPEIERFEASRPD